MLIGAMIALQPSFQSVISSPAGQFSLFVYNCTDSDGGTIITIKGTTSGIAQNGTRITKTDYCTSINQLDEYYCASPRNLSDILVNCQANYVCNNGACVTCTDSDKGINTTAKGTVRGLTVNNTITTKTDYCASNSAVTEYYCSGAYINTTLANCPANYICTNGACVSNITICTPSCSGTHTPCSSYLDYATCISHGCAVVNPIQNTTNYTAQNTTNSTLYCVGTPHSCASLVTQSECQNNHGCTWNACANCTDSDSGINIYIKGNTTAVTQNGTTISSTDYCISGSSLTEYYCSGVNMNKTTANCPTNYTCSSGACIANVTIQCTVGWKCKDSSTLGYQKSDCSWSSIGACASGYVCSNGACVGTGSNTTTGNTTTGNTTNTTA